MARIQKVPEKDPVPLITEIEPQFEENVTPSQTMFKNLQRKNHAVVAR
jgi:hypothetical protein